jgi:hypothetical protein
VKVKEAETLILIEKVVKNSLQIIRSYFSLYAEYRGKYMVRIISLHYFLTPGSNVLRWE